MYIHFYSHSSHNQPKLERTQMLFSRSMVKQKLLQNLTVLWGEKWSCFLQLIKIPDKMRFLWYYKYEKTCKLFIDACVSPTVCIWVCYVSVLSMMKCRFWRSRGVNYVMGGAKESLHVKSTKASVCQCWFQPQDWSEACVRACVYA